MIKLFTNFLILLTFALATNAQPTAPILRIETGMHTAVIKRIGVDRNGKYLVTASEDKTARVWEISSGRLLQTLRIPIGEGDEGKIFAAAISPDGKTIALGGWTSNESGNSESIYLFDRESGKLQNRLSGLPNVINHLTFSPNGKYLATVLGEGIRLYETTNWQQIGSDTDYGSSSYGSDFDSNGQRLVTTCDDGYLRLYSVSSDGLTLLAKKTANGGKEPFSVKFSPDGSQIAVGFNDSTAVNVLSANDLSFLFAPDATGIDNGNLSTVAWSLDGSTLLAGGRYDKGGESLIRSWSNGGRGSYREASATPSTISDIQPLQSGGFVYGGADPSWGIIDAQGERNKFIVTVIADYTDLLENFKVSDDGSELSFAYEYRGKSPKIFSLTNQTLKDKSSDKILSSPKIDSLNITDWRNNYEPKLNGTKLKLKQYEMSRSVAIAPAEDKFLLGTEWRVRLFDRNGTELWNIPIPGVAWSVNISGDGKTGVAAFGDGTIRWYRLTDGKELLTFFPHNDKKRWVMWTPTGYYDASPGAEDLIGWHVNNGKDAAADFFPVGLFRNRFYRPDVVAKVLYTQDEATALRLADEESGRKQQQQADIAKQLPPVVEILSPRDGTEATANQITIRYNVRSNEPVTNVKALVDGRPMERGVGNKSTNANEIIVNIPERDCEISLIAENRFAPSVPATVRIKWKGQTPQITAENLKPKLYILAVGVSKYANAEFNLGLPSKDADDFVGTMQKQKGLLYRDIEVKLLTDAEATRDNIVDGLDWITKATTSRDVAMVFIAGHGINDNLNRYYFAPHNFNPDSVLRTGVTFSDIKNAVEAIAGKTLFFIDTCHSGNSIGTAKRRDGAVDIAGMVNELSSAENGAVVFNASTGKQVSLEDAAWGNGAFTKALIEGLSGKAASANGKITVKSLDFYISERVKQLTGGRQTPTTAVPDTVPDFPIAARQ
jgi:WD40 repeat protein